MINILIADDNIEFAVNLMNYINRENRNIKVCYIAKDGNETLEILNNKNDIDVILLDYKMPVYNAIEVLKRIEKKERYLDSCIIISGEIESIIEIRKNELMNSFIYKGTSITQIVKEINKLLKNKELVKRDKIVNNKIMEQILLLGYDISHKGTQYLIKSIEYVYNNNIEIENLEKEVYPKVALMCNEKVHNIKCRINRATDHMYYNCSIDKIKKYFCFDIDAKPKIKTIINTIISNIE